MSEIPDPDWTLEEEEFLALFGPLFVEPADAWALYADAVEQLAAWSENYGGVPDLDNEDDADALPAMQSWINLHEDVIAGMSDEQALAFAERLVAQFVGIVEDAVDTWAMILERQPSLAPQLEKARALVVADIEATLGRYS